ncbi:putative N-acetyltransferase YvbK [Paenibacillus plantiphilus]|uniref:N-acetyltransferase YvbK n=1 Tax=Paenibacillus plantiphilus TaxID=2905650 RepID=A0ABN8GS57_9BACL|nr:GNAT family N-acetyltransferase [Paenibacillus plantiphilus]CAH1215252.1 putative N-acetyltransferase YvbK [Paenibacillus plantiphilus]
MEYIRALALNEPHPVDLLLLADPEIEVVKSYIDRSLCFVMEREQGQPMIGVYALLPTRPQTIELVNIAVAEHEQGKGYGRQLTLHAIVTAASLGYKTIEVGTGNSSLLQLGLYQKCGFRIVGVDRDFFPRHYVEPIYEDGIPCRDMIRMEMEL